MAASASGDIDLLGRLRARLVSGVAPALGRTRPADRHLRDSRALNELTLRSPGGALETLDALDRIAWQGADLAGRVRIDALLKTLAERLGKSRAVVLAVLYSPGEMLDRLATEASDPVRAWWRACWVGEAVWGLANDGSGDRLSHDDWQMMRPVVARLRFLLLSEPFRGRGAQATAWLPQHDGAPAPLERLFGVRSWNLLVGRCRESRWAWQRCLDEYQSHPLLARATPVELEQELGTLLFADSHARALVIGPLGLAAHAQPGAADAAVAAETLEQHLLPRFMLGNVRSLAAAFPFTDSPPAEDATPADARRRRLGLAAALPPAAAVAAIAVAVVPYPRSSWRIPLAAWTGAGCYLLLLAGVVWFGRIWATQWLLRLPAASAVGLLVLITLPPHWWQAPAWPPWPALVLAAGAYGYLVAEVRNHGVAAKAAAGRALVVTGIGAVHAGLVSLVGLVLVAPAYLDSGPRLTSLWQHDPPGQRLTVLALATGWCLAVGVFSQILWDDRPITAPLAHLQWRRGS